MSNQQQTRLVSIALATYNGEKFLAKQIDSLLNQTYQNIEIVISDDGSTDNTIQILEEYSRKDSRVTFSKSPGRLGFIMNFNRAISLCKGDFVFLCDQDDVWFENKIQEHLEIYQDENIKWIYNEVNLVDETGKYIGVLPKNHYRGITLFYMTGGRCILGCATSYRMNSLKKILPLEPLAPGHDSYIQLALYPEKSFYIEKTLQDYRQHTNSVTNQLQVNKTTVDENIKKSIKYVKELYRNKKLGFYLLWKST